MMMMRKRLRQKERLEVRWNKEEETMGSPRQKWMMRRRKRKMNIRSKGRMNKEKNKKDRIRRNQGEETNWWLRYNEGS